MKKLITGLCLLTLMAACAENKAAEEPVEPPRKTYNAIYYWKTTFKLSDGERKFLTDNRIERLYLRFFDVYRDRDFDYETVPVPEATLQFLDKVPTEQEVVPTVFIDNQLFKDCDMTSCAKLLVDRIRVMAVTNDINIREVQLDCDWTKTTEEAYFQFLHNVRQLLKKDTVVLSATIRLHQLAMKAPPVDCGALMCYNTGSVRKWQTENSILAASDVAPYAKHIKDYALPLDVAYPAFSWAVWFSDKEFQALLRNLTPDNKHLEPVKGNLYRVKKGFYHEGKFLAADDEVRFENSDFQEILKTKKLVESKMEKFSVIVYHLDYNKLSKYSEDEISQIFAR